VMILFQSGTTALHGTTAPHGTIPHHGTIVHHGTTTQPTMMVMEMTKLTIIHPKNPLT